MTRWGELVVASETPPDPSVEPPDVQKARRIVNEWDCYALGHSWDLEVADNRPVRLICGRCGESYSVEPNADPPRD